jgi:hypothetical protein
VCSEPKSCYSVTAANENAGNFLELTIAFIYNEFQMLCSDALFGLLEQQMAKAEINVRGSDIDFRFENLHMLGLHFPEEMNVRGSDIDSDEK